VFLADDLGAGIVGARLTILSGSAAGRSLYCVSSDNGLVMGSAMGEAQTRLFDFVEAGDEMGVDNGHFLAYCHYYRHHLSSAGDLRRLSVDGRPIYPQHRALPAMSFSPPVFGGMESTGRLRRRLFLLQHAYDTSGWPAAAVAYQQNVAGQLGDQADERFRLWWVDKAERMPGSMIPPRSRPVPATRLVDSPGAYEAALDAMVAWVEEGVIPPPSTSYSYDADDKRLRLAPIAAQRGGIQPVVSVTANGGPRAEVRLGEEVRFDVVAETPPAAGSIVEVAWDYDGAGKWPDVHVQTAPSDALRHEASNVYDQGGTYFPAVRIVTHPRGDQADRHAR
jgi:hypothetical protein